MARDLDTRFRTILRRWVTPTLKAHGFAKQGNVYERFGQCPHNWKGAMVQGLRPIERSQLLDNPGGARVRDGRESGAKMGWSDHGDCVGVSRALVANREPRVDTVVATRCHNRP